MSLYGPDKNAPEEPTDIWQLYEKGVKQHATIQLEKTIEKAFRFYEGDQWHGLEAGGEKFPSYNFIRPIIDYRLNMVAMNKVEIVYTPTQEGETTEQVCSALTRMAADQWERLQMDKTCWKAIKNACISGNTYLYFPEGGAEVQVVPSEDLYLADEQDPNLQNQKYILFRERRFVEDVKREARENKVPEEEISLIAPDEDQRDEKREEVDRDAKCTCLLLLRKVRGVVHIAKSARNVIYKPDTPVHTTSGNGENEAVLTLYPLAGMIWGPRKDSSRGLGEVTPLIPNQIETNRTLVRRALAVKLCAYGKPVYLESLIENPEAMAEAGTAIKVRTGSIQDVRGAVTYLEPASMSSDAHLLQEELVNRTRELAGAGDAATGQVDPTKTSGAAIIAARDQAAIPLNEPTAAFQQMAEDVALIWLDLWAVYGRKSIPYGDGAINPWDLRALGASVKVDVTPTDPFSKYSVEQSLENALAGGFITFEEYAYALPDNAAAPKAKFMEIAEKRRKAQETQPQQVLMPPEGGMESVLPPL